MGSGQIAPPPESAMGVMAYIIATFHDFGQVFSFKVEFAKADRRDEREGIVSDELPGSEVEHAVRFSPKRVLRKGFSL